MAAANFKKLHSCRRLPARNRIEVQVHRSVLEAFKALRAGIRRLFEKIGCTVNVLQYGVRRLGIEEHYSAGSTFDDWVLTVRKPRSQRTPCADRALSEVQ